MNTATLEKMGSIGLQGMKESFQTSLETREFNKLSPDEFIHQLVQAEWDYRQNKKMQTLLKNAHFRYQASIEEIEYSTGRNLDKNTFTRLAECSFIKKGENVLITGATGAGKSYIASALGHQCCIKGFKVLYYSISRLFTQLKMSKADGSYLKMMSKLEKMDVIILDDFGTYPMDLQAKLNLLELLEDRHGKRCTIIASQIPVSQWYDVLIEQTIADAILDRLVHKSHRIEILGESMRRIKPENNNVTNKKSGTV